MRRTLTILCLLFVNAFFIACGERNTNIANSNANAQSNAAVPREGGASGSAGIGPENQGIGGTSEGNSNVVNSNTYTTPPGLDRKGDRGSASNTSNTP